MPSMPWLDWWLWPLSGSAHHVVSPGVSWHGRLMVLAWGVAVPAAVLVARFFKVTPHQRWPEELDNKFWWHGHRFLNYAALVLMAFAASLVIGQGAVRAPVRAVHAWLGWAVLVLASVQLASAHLRGSKGGPTAPRLSSSGLPLDLRGDHYDMTPRRVRFEQVHKLAGATAVLLAMVAGLTGLWAADAPRWMLLCWLALWVGHGAAFVLWQRQGRCLDTYQAIWGPHRGHPGNSMPVVGWGIRRALPGESAADAALLSEPKE